MDSKSLLKTFTYAKKLFLALLVLPLFFANNEIVAQNRQPSGMLKFSEGSNILELKLSNNRQILKDLEKIVEINLHSINDGDKYISITSYIKSTETGDFNAINEASLKGSVVRAHFKIKYSLSNFNFSFSIDNSSQVDNAVKIEVKDGSPSLHNNEIFYTTSKINLAVKAAVEKYGEVPYATEVKQVVVETPAIQKYKPRLTERSTVTIPSMRFYSSSVQKSVKVTHDLNSSIKVDIRKILSANDRTVALYKSPINTIPEPTINKSIQKKYYQPLFGIKSNLVYWYGLTPNLSKSDFIPNAEIEVFYSGRLSTSVEGFYTPFGEISSDAQEWFKESGLIAEQKFWFGKIKRYNTLYLGVVGLYGDYDYRDLEKSELGLTGTYYGAGLSIGFLVPVYKGICFEIGVRGVYKLDNWESYKVRNGGFYREESGRNSGIDLCGVKFSFQYRFGKSRNN